MLQQTSEKASRLLASQKGLTEAQAGAEVSKHQAEMLAEMIEEQFLEQQVQRLKLSREIDHEFNRTSSRAAKTWSSGHPWKIAVGSALADKIPQRYASNSGHG